jgi:hypothetical protein
MRGSPIIRALAAFLVLLALWPVLARVTTPSVQAKAAVAEVVAKKVQLALSFTAAPKRVAIVHLGKEVWAKSAPAAEEELTLDIPWPAQGGELVFRVEWPDGAPLSAMRAKLTDPQDVEIERSLWGSGPTETVLNFP